MPESDSVVHPNGPCPYCHGKGDYKCWRHSVETAKAAPVRVDAGETERYLSAELRPLLPNVVEECGSLRLRNAIDAAKLRQVAEELDEAISEQTDRALHEAVAAAREACARIAESKAHFHPVPANYTASEIAAAIRARGKA